MNKDFKRLTDFLVGMGIEQIPHTHKSYLTHLIAVFTLWNHRDTRKMSAGRGCSTRSTAPRSSRDSPFRSSAAAMFVTLIGDRAERLAYLNCAMARASLDRILHQAAEPYQIIDRITGVKWSTRAEQTSTTSVACISLTGWNKFLGCRSGTIAGLPTEGWLNG